MSRYPLLSVLISLVSGIVTAGFYPLAKPHALWVISIFLFGVIIVISKHAFRHYLALFILFFIGGYVLTLWNDEQLIDNHYTRLSAHKADVYLAEALAAPVPTKRAYRHELRLLAKHSKENVTGTVYLYTPKDSAFAYILPGDKVLFSAHLKPIGSPLNPHEFDYRNYLHLHNIFAQGYSRELKVIALGGNSLTRYAGQVRSSLLGYINQLKLDEEETAIASALLVGYRHLITDETTRNFAGAGAMHVLAVSGLHVGILYIITAFLLGINRKKPHQNPYPKVILAVVIIWLYALVTGLSPSVTRASVMFTFIAFGNLSRRPSSTIQAIIASALFLLLLKPNFLFEVGFQLSYAAVLGIVILQPRIYNLFPRTGFKIINLGLQITAVSIAAQLATFALSLYYFHQFPVWFVVSNLFVIPLAYALMCYGIFLLLVSVFISPPALLIAPFKGLMWLMLGGIEWVNQLPGALLTGLWVNRFELVCITIFAFGISSMYFNKNKKAAFASVLAAIGFFASNVLTGLNHRHDNGITLYSVPKMCVIELHQDERSYLIAPEVFLKDEDAKLFYVTHNIWAKGIQQAIPINLHEDTATADFTLKNGLLETRSTKLLILKEATDSAMLDLKPNVVVIANTRLTELQSSKARTVILNGIKPREIQGYQLGEQGALFIPTK